MQNKQLQNKVNDACLKKDTGKVLWEFRMERKYQKQGERDRDQQRHLNQTFKDRGDEDREKVEYGVIFQEECVARQRRRDRKAKVSSSSVWLA